MTKVAKDSLMDEVVNSIFKPGVNMRIQTLIHGIFSVLITTLLFLLWLSSFSIHVVFLNCVAASLWATLTWYIILISRFFKELATIKLKELPDDIKDPIQDNQESVQKQETMHSDAEEVDSKEPALTEEQDAEIAESQARIFKIVNLCFGTIFSLFVTGMFIYRSNLLITFLAANTGLIWLVMNMYSHTNQIFQ